MTDRPESHIQRERHPRTPDQLGLKVVAANGQTIAVWPTQYNDDRDADRALLLVAGAVLDEMDRRGLVLHEVHTVNQDDPEDAS